MLCILTIFKNESQGMDEWIQHYLSQGVSHIFMINNGSTDNYMPILDKYSTFLTLYHLPEPHVQIHHYNTVFPDIRASGYTWCGVFDMDEFVVLSDPSLSLPDYCKRHLHGDVHQIRIQWKLFGSSGHIEQPPSIRCGFIHCDPEIVSHKVIFRIDACKFIRIHDVEAEGESILATDALIYHYPIQSWDWFSKVKMTRGAADDVFNVRNRAYFDHYNARSTEVDTTLTDRVEAGLYAFTQ
jgi:hypothetical protein